MSFLSEGINLVRSGAVVAVHTQATSVRTASAARDAALWNRQAAQATQLLQNLSRMAVDFACLVDPTGALSLGQAVFHACTGNLVEAGFDLLGAVPAAGKGVRVTRVLHNMPLYLGTVTRAVHMAGELKRLSGPAHAVGLAMERMMVDIYHMASTALRIFDRQIVPYMAHSGVNLRGVRQALESIVQALRGVGHGNAHSIPVMLSGAGHHW